MPRGKKDECEEVGHIRICWIPALEMDNASRLKSRKHIRRAGNSKVKAKTPVASKHGENEVEMDLLVSRDVSP